ncbi:MAG TPA: Calx-beta domain-containing protein, partial [Pyrinomonadaceae bacterium]
AVQTTTARVKIEAVGNIYFDISDVNFAITNLSPNLTPYQPAGWSDKIVVSNAPGGSTDSSPLRTTDTLYVDWAVINSGVGPTGSTFFIRLLVDGVERASWVSEPPLGVNFYNYILDYQLGQLGAGTHTVKIVADSTGAVSESNESDNEYTKTINVVAPSTVQLGGAALSVSEGAGVATVTVTRGGVTSGPAAVNDVTTDAAGASNCALVSGAASSRCDYVTAVGTLNFAANETSKAITIPVVNDSYAEGSENLTVTLSAPSGVALGSPAAATLTITDNDVANGSNPLSQSGFFVGQHYLDFLNRPADSSGLAFWSNEINSCGGVQSCVDVKRINVSAAFFLSIEFQETGYLVYRAYKAAYGNLPGAPVPVTLGEFMPDTQAIARGLVVGQVGWQNVLEANKQNFLNEFVQRARFNAAYPAAMTAAQFVDTLNARAGGPLSAAERNQLVSELAAGTRTRAQVLRAVAEDPDLHSAETNRAFVLMQYFGYLRRNPNDAPDADFAGYNFWLGKLNQFGGNFVNAEMVKAFITSTEYRTRFGPN